MVTDPPKASTRRPAPGSWPDPAAARPRSARRGTGAGDESPRRDTSRLRLSCEVSGSGLLHGGVRQANGIVEATAVGAGLVQGVSRVQRGTVGRIEQTGAASCTAVTSTPPTTSINATAVNPRMRMLIWPRSGPGRGPGSRPPGPAPLHPPSQRRHRNRSTVATWVADTGMAVGTTPANTDGTRGSGTVRLAVTSTLPSGRKHGVPSHAMSDRAQAGKTLVSERNVGSSLRPGRALCRRLRGGVGPSGLTRGSADGVRAGLQPGHHHDEVEQRHHEQDGKEHELHDRAAAASAGREALPVQFGARKPYRLQPERAGHAAAHLIGSPRRRGPRPAGRGQGRAAPGPAAAPTRGPRPPRHLRRSWSTA